MLDIPKCNKLILWSFFHDCLPAPPKLISIGFKSLKKWKLRKSATKSRGFSVGIVIEMVIWALQCLSPESAWYRSVVSRVFIDRQRGTTVAPLHHNAPHHPLPLRPKQTTVLLTTLAWPPKIRLLYLLSSSQLLNCTRNWHQTWNIEMQCAAFNAAHSVPECGFEGLKC